MSVRGRPDAVAPAEDVLDSTQTAVESARSTRTSPAAVLWDMDGTLVDTEPYWIATEFALAERYGGTWSQEHALALVGNDLLVSARYILEHMFGGRDVGLTPEQVVEELLDGVVERVRAEVPWRPGVRELIGDLRAAGVPLALVTMSYTRFVDPVLEHLPPQTFSAVVTGDRVSQGKPHPEPYLRAAEELGAAPTACVAIEDSDTGATSAAAAGCVVLCVPHHVDIEPGPRRVFRESLAGVTATELAGLVGLVAEGETGI